MKREKGVTLYISEGEYEVRVAKARTKPKVDRPKHMAPDTKEIIDVIRDSRNVVLMFITVLIGITVGFGIAFLSNL